LLSIKMVCLSVAFAHPKTIPATIVDVIVSRILG
jgi:hypothetical protein